MLQLFGCQALWRASGIQTALVDLIVPHAQCVQDIQACAEDVGWTGPFAGQLTHLSEMYAGWFVACAS